jgi:DMSO/TMAO reductase YedYZ molybdopterin-dependent catalytic subunit
LNGFITPVEHFFVRNHFPVPTIEAKTWRLAVDGHVGNVIRFTIDELKQFSARSVTATLECSGNGRGFLEPKKQGVQWLQGAVGNAKWTGVPLAAVLERAKIKDAAADVVFVGADSGETKEGQKTPFLRSLPLKKAMQSNVLLAYAMNDGELPRDHGFPLRVVVPGWFGVASVKWLTRIFVTDRPFTSNFQSMDYSIWQRDGGLANLVPVTSLMVKSTIARPVAGTTLPAGKEVSIAGAAWTGDDDIATVEISADGGATWNKATLEGRAVPFAWRLWQFSWRTPQTPGKFVLMARATDSAGNVQPLTRDDDRRSYLINHVIPVPVEVR